MNGWSDGGVTIATAAARWRRNPSGGEMFLNSQLGLFDN